MLGANPENVYVGALLRGLNELGYADDVQFTTFVRSAEGSPDRFAAVADELVRASTRFSRARRLALAVSPALRLRADQVIE